MKATLLGRARGVCVINIQKKEGNKRNVNELKINPTRGFTGFFVCAISPEPGNEAFGVK